jgi:hypothetical protein
MATIACPGCGKQFKLPSDAAGKTASCTCGKRFKIGGAPLAMAPAKAAVAKPAAASKPAAPSSAKAPPVAARQAAVVKQAAAPNAKPAANPVIAGNKLDDDFWNEGLKEPLPKTVAAPIATPAPKAAVAGAGRPAAPTTTTKKKRKRKEEGEGFRWGADWGKAAGGLGMFVIFGGLSVAEIMYWDRIHIYFPVLAIGGLFTALSGMMGD